MNRITFLRAMVVLIAAVALVSPAYADIVFQDNFNTENGGVPALNYYSFTNWTVTGTNGSVDLIGNGTWDGYPGNGLYVDLAGSTSATGLLATMQTFGPGTYILEFDIGKSPWQNVSNIVTVTFGDWSTMLDYSGQAPTNVFDHRTFTFTTTETGVLSFYDAAANVNFGAYLDNVQVNLVPIPAALWLFGSGLVGLVVLRRKRTR